MKCLLLLLMLMISSCSTTIYQLRTECNQPVAEIFQKITEELKKENFTITTTDLNSGILEAETSEVADQSGILFQYQWIFKYDSGTLTACSTINHLNEDGNVEKTYLNDETGSVITNYWNIRNSIINICRHKLYIIKNP